MAVAADRLTAVLTLDGGTTLYSFAKGTKLTLPHERPSAVYPVPGVDRGIDPRGQRRNTLAKQEISWTFLHVYARDSFGVLTESWASVRDAMVLAFANRGNVLLQKVTGPRATSAPLTLVCEAKYLKIDGPITIDTQIFGEFTVTFQQYEDWRPLVPVGYAQYDSGARYDDPAVRYDASSSAVAITGGTTNFILTNNGTVTETSGSFSFYGPLVGPFILYNLSCAPDGTPGVYDTTNCMWVLINDTLSVNTVGGNVVTDLYTLDCKQNQVITNRTSAGVIGWTLVKKAAGQQPYFAVVPGANSCRIVQQGSGTTGSFFSQFYDRFS